MADENGIVGATVGVKERQPPPHSDRPDIRMVLLAVIALVVVGWGLRATGSIMIPLVSAILIALAVMPARDWVRRRMPDRFRWAGVVAAMTLLLVVTGLFFGALWIAGQQVIGKLPEGAGQAVAQAAQGGTGGEAAAGPALPLGLPEGSAGQGGAPGSASEAGSLLQGSGEQLAARFGDTILSVLEKVATTILDSAMSIGSGLVVIFFLSLLILIESDDWRRKIASVTQPWNGWRLTESAEVIAQKVRVYLLVRAVLGLVTAALYGLWLWIFGADLIVAWMILTFLLNFIPTVGSIIAGLLPMIYVYLTQDFGTAMTVGLGLLVIEQIMGNYVDPLVSGSRVAVSPLVVLVALLVWSWVWGIPGALLAVPVTVSLVVLGAHVPILRPWALLLSDRTDMAGLKKATQPD